MSVLDISSMPKASAGMEVSVSGFIGYESIANRLYLSKADAVLNNLPHSAVIAFAPKDMEMIREQCSGRYAIIFGQLEYQDGRKTTVLRVSRIFVFRNIEEGANAVDSLCYTAG